MPDLPQIVRVRLVGGNDAGIERLFRKLFPETHRMCQEDGNEDADRLYRCFRSIAPDLVWDQIGYCCQLLIPTKNYYSAELGFGWHQGLVTQNARFLALIIDPVVRVSRQMALDLKSGLAFKDYSEWATLTEAKGGRIYTDNYQCRTLLTDGWLTAHTHFNVHMFERMRANHGETLFAAPEDKSQTAVGTALEFLGFNLPNDEIANACKPEPLPMFELTRGDIRLIREHNAWDTKLFEAISEKPRSGLSQLFSTLKPKG